MKKYILLVVVVIVAVTSIGYLYSNYISNNMQMKNNNKEYIDILDKEISGSNLASIINKTIDKNIKNNVEKDKNGYFKDNGTNSIIIKIKFKDSDTIFFSEQIANRGIENFISLYSNIRFRCKKIEYHSKTKYVSCLYFEQT